MEYRRLGKAGVKVSVLSFGSWVTFKTQVQQEQADRLLAIAYEHGVNFFDNAEVYAGGESETLMGDTFQRLGLRRGSFLVSTKLFWGLHDRPNERHTLNRKYLLEGIDGSLRRLKMEYVDLLYCHRPDPHTPLEETVQAMHDIIHRGKALYWGTSEWSAEEIARAVEIAERNHLHKPVVEQPQYNLFARTRVEKEYARILDDIGIGLTTWSPLASGVLSGKYQTGIPAGSRASLPGYEWIRDRITKDRLEIVAQLMPIAAELGCSMAQLAIAWCTKNPKVSSVITGATREDQLLENLAAVAVIPRLTAPVMQEINQIVGGGD
jgi:voltage-dependent potassium channel beta subunit